MAFSVRSRLTAAAGALALAGAAMMMSAAPAFADHGPSPSDSADACADAGGTFADLGDGVTTCTVVETETRLVAGSDPNGKWTVELTDTTTTVYTTTVTEEWVGGEEHCQNAGGEAIPYAAWDPADPLVGNPNCVAAYENGGTQPEAPGFTIVTGGYWETVVTHAQDGPSTTTARTDCWNPGNQRMPLTETHCQVPGID